MMTIPSTSSKSLVPSSNNTAITPLDEVGKLMDPQVQTVTTAPDPIKELRALQLALVAPAKNGTAGSLAQDFVNYQRRNNISIDPESPNYESYVEDFLVEIAKVSCAQEGSVIFSKDLLPIEKQGISNQGNNCYLNAALISLKDMFRHLRDKNKPLTYIREQYSKQYPTLNFLQDSEYPKDSPLTAFLQNCFDVTDRDSACLLRLEVKNILFNSGEEKHKQLASQIDKNGNVRSQGDALDPLAYLSEAIGIDTHIHHLHEFQSENPEKNDSSTNITSILTNSKLEISEDEQQQFTIILNKDVTNRIRVTGISDPINVSGSTKNVSSSFQPSTIICHLANSRNSGHYITISSVDNQWYVTSNHETKKISLEDEIGNHPPNGVSLARETKWREVLEQYATVITYKPCMLKNEIVT